MRNILLFCVAVAGIIVAGSANAMTFQRTDDLGIHNGQHLCKYSNGKTYAFNLTDLCPLTVEDDNIATNTPGHVPVTGFKAGEYQDGMTKVCVYKVLGNEEAIRIGSTEICPLTQDF